MKRCVIVGGAEIRDYERVRAYMREGDFNVFCDSGLRHMEGLGLAPNLIVGDFDSYANPNLPVETIVLPREKDDTDTVYAVREAVRRGFEDFLLAGVVGNRLDHTLANVSILLYLDGLGLKALAVDDYSEMEIVSGGADAPTLIPDSFSFFSLLNISGKAAGVSIKNAKYPLRNAEMNCEYQYGVSNEVLPGKTAEVSLSEGRLLLIKVK
ncbi:MAG TPA: thiamine diphosphokinase [Bacillota bacterium]|nr:thiamine diphosphokinase [Bacillota bacterium]HQC35880.1 thiamine diphosphokinase [Bacillota bacterium]